MYWDKVIRSKMFQDALTKAYCREETVYPSYNDVFRPFELFSPEETKVVILGQDPYHNGTADGLAFSCKTKIPPSLRNIFKAMKHDIGNAPTSGDLTYLAKQGVMLLNTSLTVSKGKPNSHEKIWRNVVIEILTHLRKVAPNCIFVLWGRNAQKMGWFLPNQICSCHPSPLVRNSDFIQNKHFSEINKLLYLRDLEKIVW